MTAGGLDDDFDEELNQEPTFPPKKPRGRPRKVGKKVTKVTRQEYVEPDDDEEDDDTKSPSSSIFDSESTENGMVRIRVSRSEPNEGMLGYLDDPANVTEKDIFEKWGGSVYRCDGVNAKGQILKTKTFRIAGDPIFVTTMTRLQWEKNRRNLSTEAGANQQAAPVQQGMSVQEMLAFFREQETARATAEREHQEKMRKLEEEAENRRRREQEETERKRKLDDEDRDRRRKLDDEERERRRLIAQEETEKRQHAHMQQTITMIQAANTQSLDFIRTTIAATPTKGGSGDLMDAIKAIAAIKEAFGGEGGEESTDPLAIVARHGGEWLNGIGNAVGAAIREVKGNPGGQPGATPPTHQQVLPPVGGSGSSGLMLPESLAPKVAALVSKIAARGQDPETVLGQIVDNVLVQIDQVPPPTQSTGQQTSAPTSNPQTANRTVDKSGLVTTEFSATPDAAPNLHGSILMGFG